VLTTRGRGQNPARVVSTIPDLIDGLLAGRAASTVRAYRADLDDFARWRGMPLVEAATQLLAAGGEEGGRIAQRYAAQLRRSGRSPATIDRRMGTLRLLVRQAWDLGLVDWSLGVDDWGSMPDSVEEPDDVAYLLPRHPAEIDRLDLQHYALGKALGGHYLAPVERLSRVLDVGSGTGQWGYDVRRERPGAVVVGFDLVAPKPGAPGGYHAVRGNLLRGLPFADASFDFVHQRLLFSGVPVDAWPATVHELVRVCRPGGWVELVEGATEFGRPGPASEKLASLLRRLNRTAGLDAGSIVFRSLDRYLVGAGLDVVARRTVDLPLGEWGGIVGSLMASDIRALFSRVMPAFAARLGVSEAESVELLRAAQLEWEDLRTTYGVAVAWGRASASRGH
jgi:SAM-dependent methyltransferase